MNTVVLTQRPGTGYNAQWAYPSSIGGLGDLYQRGSEDIIATMLIDKIIAKANPSFSRGSLKLSNLFNLSYTIIKQGESNSLPTNQQANWDAWKKQALGTKGLVGVGDDPDVFWSLVHLVQTRGRQLSEAAFDAEKAGSTWRTDPDQACNVLMVASGTGLSKKQWYLLSSEVFHWTAQEIIKGVLNLNYLAAVFQGFLQPDTAARKFPIWLPPEQMHPHDPVTQGAFGLYLKKSGWSDIVRRWGRYAATTWASTNAAIERKTALLGSIHTTLSYASGQIILDKINNRLNEFSDIRARSIDTLQRSAELLTNENYRNALHPLTILKLQAAEKKFIEADTEAYQRLAPVGLWQESEKYGARALEGLGWIKIAVGGAIAITALALIAYIIHKATAAEQSVSHAYTEAFDQIQEMVKEAQKSCKSDLDKGLITEEEYRSCIERATNLYSKLPPKPDATLSSTTKNMALIAAAGIGAFALMKMKG